MMMMMILHVYINNYLTITEHTVENSASSMRFFGNDRFLLFCPVH